MARQAPTVADVAWSFFEALAASGAPQGTKSRYKSNMLAMLDELGSRSITSVTSVDLTRFVEAHPSPNVRTSRRTIAHHVMSHALRYGYIRTPVEATPESYRPRQARNRQWTRYNAEQLRTLKDSASCQRSRIAISIAIHTAMRIEDIRTLRAPAPDLADGWLSTWIHKSGIFDLKVIANSFEVDMRQYLTWLYSQADGAVTSTDYLIPGYRTYSGFNTGNFDPDTAPCNMSRPFSKGSLDNRFLEARDRAQLPYLTRERWHTLRRSSGRLFFEAASDRGYDMALRMTQAFLNHSSVKTTERYIGLDSAYAMRDQFLREHDLLGTSPQNVIPLTQRRSS
ncbi:tyrosine-type recombinase/integrase [Streptomyces sp. NPDC002855]|uniref:tyrosine-type recombinase/integrase n=1 Tax=Streptomyces sp. NPDC002855 TaxID=3154437 RepID=UPI00332E8975